jgi:hypothetical protein
MVTTASVIAYAQQLAQTDVNGISSALGLAFYNDALQDMTRDLINKGIDAAQVAESFTTLSSSDTLPGQFAWPTDMFALKTIEVDFTNSGGSNYIQATKLDVANLQNNTSFDYVRKNQSTSEPAFTNHGDTGEVFPTVTGTCLVRILYYLVPTESTAVSDTVSYPQTLDYRMLSAKMNSLYYKSQEKFEIAKGWEEDYQIRLNKIGNILAPQSKQPILPEKLRITGWEY